MCEGWAVVPLGREGAAVPPEPLLAGLRSAAPAQPPDPLWEQFQLLWQLAGSWAGSVAVLPLF